MYSSQYTIIPTARLYSVCVYVHVLSACLKRPISSHCNHVVASRSSDFPATLILMTVMLPLDSFFTVALKVGHKIN